MSSLQRVLFRSLLRAAQSIDASAALAARSAPLPRSSPPSLSSTSSWTTFKFVQSYVAELDGTGALRQSLLSDEHKGSLASLVSARFKEADTGGTEEAFAVLRDAVGLVDAAEVVAAWTTDRAAILSAVAAAQAGQQPASSSGGGGGGGGSTLDSQLDLDLTLRGAAAIAHLIDGSTPSSDDNGDGDDDDDDDDDATATMTHATLEPQLGELRSRVQEMHCRAIDMIEQEEALNNPEGGLPPPSTGNKGDGNNGNSGNNGGGGGGGGIGGVQLPTTVLPLFDRLRLLTTALSEVEGFSIPKGQSPLSPDHSHLRRVLESKAGLPISLTLVYMAVARDLGIALEPVNFPGTFLACVRSDLFAPPPASADGAGGDDGQRHGGGGSGSSSSSSSSSRKGGSSDRPGEATSGGNGNGNGNGNGGGSSGSGGGISICLETGELRVEGDEDDIASRCRVLPALQALEGTWWAVYAGHGVEIVQFEVEVAGTGRSGRSGSGSGSHGGSAGNGKEGGGESGDGEGSGGDPEAADEGPSSDAHLLRGTKITGDSFVPAGERTFEVRVPVSLTKPSNPSSSNSNGGGGRVGRIDAAIEAASASDDGSKSNQESGGAAAAAADKAFTGEDGADPDDMDGLGDNNASSSSSTSGSSSSGRLHGKWLEGLIQVADEGFANPRDARAQLLIFDDDEASLRTIDGLQLNFRRCDASDGGQVLLSPASGGMLLSRRQATRMLDSVGVPLDTLEGCGYEQVVRRMCVNLANQASSRSGGGSEGDQESGGDDGGNGSGGAGPRIGTGEPSAAFWESMADDLVPVLPAGH